MAPRGRRPVPRSALSMAEDRLLPRLRAGDGQAYRELILREHAGLVRLARTFCGIRATAEEVV